MIAVLFEVWPNDGEKDRYIEIAKHLLPALKEIDGFISVERFQSLSDPAKILSLSFFESEYALQDWRQSAEHRTAQSAGRGRIFRDYRLRVANVLRDYSLREREQAPDDSLLHHGSSNEKSWERGANHDRDDF